jgi:hypothetical protein
MTRPKKTKSGAASDDPVEAAYDFLRRSKCGRLAFGLTVDNTQFAQFREEIIKALGACIVLTACTAVRAQPHHRYA